MPRLPCRQPAVSASQRLSLLAWRSIACRMVACRGADALHSILLAWLRIVPEFAYLLLGELSTPIPNF
eukprot:3090956-Alexandrium_andersonii.AAC.1